MATTLYLPSTSATPDISPSASAGWDVTSGFDRLIMSTAKANTSMANKTIAMTAGSSGDTTLFRQYIFGPLQAVTIAANVVWTLYVRGLEPSAAMNAFGAAGLWVATSSGTLRGTIKAGGSPGSGAEYGTSLSSRQHHGTYSNSSISVQDGDYLVLEAGMFKNSTTTGNASLNFGDDSGTDITANNVTTADNPVLVIATDLLIYNPVVDESATISLGSLTLTGLSAVAIRESEGAILSLGSQTLTGIAISASAQSAAALALGSISLTGIAAIAGYDAGASIGLAEQALTGIAFDAAASISALLSAATDLVIEGTDLTAQVTDESGDYSVLISRATITNTGTALTTTKGDAATMAAAILNLAGVEAIVRKSEQAQVAEGAITLTGSGLTATETEVGTMTRGVLTITGVEMLARAAVLAAMGRGTLTFTGTRVEGRLGFRFSQFSII